MQDFGPMASIMQITNVWNAILCSTIEINASLKGTQYHYFLGDVRQSLNLSLQDNQNCSLPHSSVTKNMRESKVS
jgi:hypothetical protein